MKKSGNRDDTHPLQTIVPDGIYSIGDKNKTYEINFLYFQSFCFLLNQSITCLLSGLETPWTRSAWVFISALRVVMKLQRLQELTWFFHKRPWARAKWPAKCWKRCLNFKIPIDQWSHTWYDSGLPIYAKVSQSNHLSTKTVFFARKLNAN